MLHRLLRQDITYWALADPAFDMFGDPLLEDPESLVGRYEGRTMLFIDTKTGNQAQSRAIVYLTDEVKVGGYLYSGVSSEADPDDVDGADQIRRVDYVPDAYGRETLYKAYL